jgi:DNA-binding transcriptional LysR family regulator
MQPEPMKVSLESLKVFCDVARRRSFSQAAQANGLTQPAVSQIVQQLEKRLGVQLIDRATRPLQVTALGRTYWDGCEDLVERYQELEAAVRAALAERAATVRVAAIYSVGLRDMSQVVQRFEAEQRGAHVEIDYLHPDRVCAEVLAGTADFGLVSFPRKSRELTTLPWREEEMVLTCPMSHPLAQNQAVDPRHLAGVRYIGFDKDLVIRRKVDQFLRSQGVSVDVVLEFDNIENIKRAIDAGAGVALLPEPTVRREVQAGTLVARPLAGCGLVRPLGIIQRRHHKPTSTAQRFIDLLRQPDEAAGNGAPHNAAGHHHNGRGRPPRKKVR